MDDLIVRAREGWVADHLVVIPSLLEHMRESVIPLAAAGTSERVSGSHEPPAPLRLGPADSADELWSYLCDFTDLVATRTGERNPIQTSDRFIRARSPHDAATAAAAVVQWLNRARYRIETDPIIEEYFRRETHLISVVRRAQQLHPVEMRQLPARFRCKVCGDFSVQVEYAVDGDPTGFSCFACGYEQVI